MRAFGSLRTGCIRKTFKIWIFLTDARFEKMQPVAKRARTMPSAPDAMTTLDPDQRRAVKMVDDGKNVLLYGFPGAASRSRDP